MAWIGFRGLQEEFLQLVSEAAIRSVPQKSCCSIYRKTPVLESFLNKVAGLTVYLYTAKFVRTPILKKIYQRLLLWCDIWFGWVAFLGWYCQFQGFGKIS